MWQNIAVHGGFNSLLSLSRFTAGTASPVLASSRWPSSEPGSVVPERSLRLADSLLLRVRGGTALPAGPGSVGLPGMSLRAAAGTGPRLAAIPRTLLIHASKNEHKHLRNVPQGWLHATSSRGINQGLPRCGRP